MLRPVIEPSWLDHQGRQVPARNVAWPAFRHCFPPPATPGLGQGKQREFRTSGMTLSPAEREAILDQVIQICIDLKYPQDATSEQRLTVDLRRLTRMLWVNADQNE